MNFIALLFHFQMELLIFFNKCFRFKINTIVLRLDVSAFVFKFFLISLILQKLFILFQFNLISFPSHLVCFLYVVLSSSFGFIEVSSQLLDDVLISSIIGSWLQSLVLKHQILNLTFESILYILEFFLVFIFWGFKLCSNDV